MFDIKTQFLCSNHRLRLYGNYVKTTITLHSTANLKSTAQNERDWLDNPSNKRDASWHYVVDEIEVIQALPIHEVAYHCGDVEGNCYSIGVEICESGDRRKTLENAAKFVAYLITLNNMTIGDIRTHQFWSGKNCPRILIDKKFIVGGMDLNYFIGRVKTYLSGEDEEDMVRYNTVGEIEKDMPYAKSTIEKLIGLKMFADKNKLDLSKDMIRIFVFNDRIGIYDKA